MAKRQTSSLAKGRKLSPNSFTPAEIAQLGAAADSCEKQTPSAVFDALLPKPLNIADLTLPAPCLDTLLQLEAIKSPFLVGGSISMLELTVTLFVLMNPPEKVDPLLLDRPKLELAARQLARQIPLSQIQDLAGKVSAHLSASFSTAIATAAAEDPNQKKIP